MLQIIPEYFNTVSSLSKLPTPKWTFSRPEWNFPKPKWNFLRPEWTKTLAIYG